MKFPKIVKDLCQPAYVYFILTLISILLYLYFVTVDSNHIKIDNYMSGGLTGNIILSLVWIFILDQMCKIPKIGIKLSWFFVLLPFVVYSFVIIGLSCSYGLFLDQSERDIRQNNSHIQVQS